MLGRVKITENCPKTLFFLENSMTIKFGNLANFIVRNFVVFWEAPTKGVFEKASAIARMRQKCVRNASKWVLFYWERGTFQNASNMRYKCVKNARNTFGGEHLLDDTEER